MKLLSIKEMSGGDSRWVIELDKSGLIKLRDNGLFNLIRLIC
ncbi:TPA: hypothetical protein ACGO1T_001070 [Streptococcus suis]